MRTYQIPAPACQASLSAVDVDGLENAVGVVVDVETPGGDVDVVDLDEDLDVKRAEGLVEQERHGPRRKRPSERHAPSPRRRAMTDADQRSPRSGSGQVVRQRATGSRPEASCGSSQAEAVVVAHRQVAKQCILLEHEADTVLLHRELRGVLAGEHQAARVGVLQPGDRPQDRALARAAAASKAPPAPQSAWAWIRTPSGLGCATSASTGATSASLPGASERRPRFNFSQGIPSFRADPLDANVRFFHSNTSQPKWRNWQTR